MIFKRFTLLLIIIIIIIIIIKHSSINLKTTLVKNLNSFRLKKLIKTLKTLSKPNSKIVDFFFIKTTSF